MPVKQLDHFNITSSHPGKTVAFYEMLGLENRPDRRPDFGVPGTWLFIGDHPAVHVNFVEDGPSGSTGAMDHIGFEAEGFEEITARLQEAGVPFTTAIRPEIALRQVYVRDPEGILVELNIRGTF